ncbi:MAG TPA: hypothetical protein VFY40_11430 [Blastocatellia bacterium]|nr:hypothetical protein [Blastocatellia bacterium]
MNQFLPNRYIEIIHRLALGIEPLDAFRGGRLSYQLQAVYDVQRPGILRPPIERHLSNLFSLRYQPGVATQLDLRFLDSAEQVYRPEYDRRRVAPRRLGIPILTLTDVEAAEAVDKQGFNRRIRRPAFFPGAAYDLGATATGMRGRVVRNGQPMRWARVTATLSGSSVIVGHAHGDDRGEFLLLIDASVTTGSALPNPLEVEISVFGPSSPPSPPSPEFALLDPLWDLPREQLDAPGGADPVAAGTAPPPDYTARVTRVIEFTLGKCLCEEPEFVIT